MATNVGNVSCDIVDASVNSLKSVIETWRVPGLDGYGAQDLGKGNAPWQARAVEYDTSANIETWFAAIEALEGSVISLETGPGTAVIYSSLLVLDVRRVRRKTVLYEGNDRVRGEIALTGVKTT